MDRDIALAGMFMVLFLTANGIAQSVRERFGEFAMLKTLGFSDAGVMALVLLGSRAALRDGGGAGRGRWRRASAMLPHFIPPGVGTARAQHDRRSVFLWAALAAALVALASSRLPALRLRQMDIATALSGR